MAAIEYVTDQDLRQAVEAIECGDGDQDDLDALAEETFELLAYRDRDGGVTIGGWLGRAMKAGSCPESAAGSLAAYHYALDALMYPPDAQHVLSETAAESLGLPDLRLLDKAAIGRAIGIALIDSHHQDIVDLNGLAEGALTRHSANPATDEAWVRALGFLEGCLDLLLLARSEVRSILSDRELDLLRLLGSESKTRFADFEGYAQTKLGMNQAQLSSMLNGLWEHYLLAIIDGPTPAQTVYRLTSRGREVLAARPARLSTVASMIKEAA